MTVDELARILAAYQQAGRGKDRVVVRGYESGLDDAVRAVEADVLPGAQGDSYYGPHRPVFVDGARGRSLSHGAPPGSVLHERVVWVVGSRDVDAEGDGVDPEGSGW